MITPRQTRLFSTADLATFQRTIISCVADASAWDRRASVVIVPSHAAAEQFRWTLEQRGLDAGSAQVLPWLLTRDEFYAELHRRTDTPSPLLSAIERLVCGRAAADEALAAGMDPPFRLRPGLVTEFLGLYDELLRRHRSVDTFERLLVEELDPSTEFDRGVRRMLRQTRFLAAMFRAYEQRVLATGRLDEHGLRRLVLDRGLRRPLRQVVVTVADRAAGPDGLWSGDYDLLSRLPELARIDVVTTATLLDGWVARAAQRAAARRGRDARRVVRRRRAPARDTGRRVRAPASHLARSRGRTAVGRQAGEAAPADRANGGRVSAAVAVSVSGGSDLSLCGSAVRDPRHVAARRRTVRGRARSGAVLRGVRVRAPTGHRALAEPTLAFRA